MAKAYSYIRFSRPEQMRGGSLRRQTEATEKWAAENDHVIDESLTDLGISAYRARRIPVVEVGTSQERLDGPDPPQGGRQTIFRRRHQRRDKAPASSLPAYPSWAGSSNGKVGDKWSSDLVPLRTGIEHGSP